MIGLLNKRGKESNRRVYSVCGLSPSLITNGGGDHECKILVLEER